MQELNVNLDIDTVSGYVLPTFPSVDSARSALKVSGVWVEYVCMYESSFLLIYGSDVGSRLCD